MLIALSAPAGNERGPLYMEQVLDALHQQRFPLGLEIGRHAHTVGLYCRFAEPFRTAVETHLRSAYPELHLTALPDEILGQPDGYCCRTIRLWLKWDVYAVKGWPAFVDPEQRELADPLAGLLAALADDALRSYIRLTVRPASLALLALYALRRLYDRSRRDDHKPPGHLWAVSLIVTVAFQRRDRRQARRKRREIAAAFGRYNNAPQARFRKVRFGWPRRFLLTTHELATLWHPPTAQVRTDKLETVPFRRLEPPAVLPTGNKEGGIAMLGRVAFHGRDDVFGIRPDDRRRHLWVVGKTGMGKSTLLENLAAADIAAGRGVAFIDPHGDSALALAAAVPRCRTNDVVLFEAWDREFPLAFNPLACRSADERHLVASEIVSTFQKVYGIDPTNAPRLLDILRNAVLALMELPGATLLSLSEMLGSETYRRAVLAHVRDPFVRSYWHNEFGQWKLTDQTLAVASVQNKLRPFIMHPLLRSILGQPKNRLDLREIMDAGRILIVNLSKGQVGEDASTLLGALLVTKLQLAAMSRADVPQHRRPDFFAYIDEFQNFATQSFATILSEARKYGLALTIANQYLDQMEEATLHAVFGNVGSMLAFQVGARDAEALAPQFGPAMQPEDLIALPKYHAYVRLLIDGMPTRPFSLTTLDRQFTADADRLRTIRNTSRHRYARPADEVQHELERALALDSLPLVERGGIEPRPTITKSRTPAWPRPSKRRDPA